MKKLSILLLALSLVLAACGSNNETQKETNNHSKIVIEDDEKGKIKTSLLQNSKEYDGLEFQEISNNHSHQQNYSHNQEVKNLSEYPILNKHFDVNNYKTQTVTDNSYKRIILFKNNKGNVKFKSIYIKNTDRLKIISTNKGLIYNGIIK